MAGIISIKDTTEEEYAKQYFTFSSRDVYEGVKDRIMPEAIINSTESLKQCLIQNFKEEDQQVKIIAACEELSKQSKTGAEKPLCNLKAALNDYFQISPNILLPEDSVQHQQFAVDDVEKVDQDILDLSLRFKQAKFMEDFLKKEMGEIVKFEDTVKICKMSDIENQVQQYSNAHLSEKVHLKIIKIDKGTSKLENGSIKYLPSLKLGEDSDQLEEWNNCTVPIE